MYVCIQTFSCFTWQTSFHGGLRSFSPFRKDFESKCSVEDGIALGFASGTHLQRICFKTHATKSLYSNLIENSQSGSIDFVDSCPDELDSFNCKPSNALSYSIEVTNELDPTGNGELKYVDDSSLSVMEEGHMNFTDQMIENSDNLTGPTEPETMSTIELTPENPSSLADSLNMDNDSVSNVKSSFDDFADGVSGSFSSSINKGENAVKSSLDTITSSITSITKSASEAVDNAVSRVFSSVDQTGDLAGKKLTSFSTDLREASSKAAVVAVDVLRRTIVALEDSISNGASFVVYSYGTTKELLPPEIRDALNLSEETVVKVLRPVGPALQQVLFSLGYISVSLLYVFR